MRTADPGRPWRVGLLADTHAGNTRLEARQDQAFRTMRELAPDHLILSGDNVERSEPAHYARLQALLAPLPMPVTAIAFQ